MMDIEEDLYAHDDSEEEHIQIDSYEISTIPNDFNLMTIVSFIESKSIVIPGFQRNYVWDIKRASRLIESLILGLPVPQMFLYEEGRNKFLVIDGQQRLMTIYYFFKGRFPKKNKRAELRTLFDTNGSLPDNILEDDQYFEKFNLEIDEIASGYRSKFHGMNYATLEDYKGQFNLRPIRNIIIKQNEPKDDDSSKYEIFNRLNTGGTNLKAQEIRASLYYSDFYKALFKLNLSPKWRRFLRNSEPDLHMKDAEIILRGLALLEKIDSYKAPMTQFLNDYSKKAATYNTAKIDYLMNLFESYLDACATLPAEIFQNKKGAFSAPLFETIFCSSCMPAYKENKLYGGNLEYQKVNKVNLDSEFSGYLQEATTKISNIKGRIKRATEILQEV